MTKHYSAFTIYALIIQTVSMIFVAFPPDSLPAWQRLKKKWRARESKLLLKRRTQADKKLKKYWEINIPKSK